MPTATAATDPACQIACPKCQAEAGAKCTNYLKKGKATCKERIATWAGIPAEERPIVCKPVGTLELGQVPNFPKEIFAPIAAAGLFTLADLEKRAETHTAYGGLDSKVFASFRSIPGVSADAARAAMVAVLSLLNVTISPTSAGPAARPLGIMNPPGPGHVLAELSGFPAEAANHLATAHKIITLADLRPHVETAAASDDQIEPAFAALAALATPTPARYKAGEILGHGLV